MGFCPKCKLEYVDGITICKDCNCKLVDSLREIELIYPVYYDSSEEYIKKLVSFLKYSNDDVLYKYDESKKQYCIYTDKHSVNTITKLLDVYFSEELEAAAKSDDPEIAKEAADIASSTGFHTEYANIIGPNKYGDFYAPPKTVLNVSDEVPEHFVKKSDKYAELHSSGICLIIVGIIGDLYIIARFIGISGIPGGKLEGINGIIFAIVMGVLFNVFLFGGISSLKRSRKIYKEIDSEEQLTKDVLNTFSTYTASQIDSNFDSGLDEGTLYYRRTDFIREELTSKFNNLDESFTEEMIEQIYERIFN